MSTFHKWYRFTVREGYMCVWGWGGGLPTRMHSESACKLIKSLLSLLAQWTWSSSTNCIRILCSEDCDKRRLSDHLIFSTCTHTHRYRGSNAGAWQRFEGSYWCKCIPCNCTSRRSALSRLDAVMSAADSICFSSFFFFFLQDLISIPTQSFRILSFFFPRLPPPLPPPPTYLFWSKQEWCKLQQRGRCHSQTAKWWRGGGGSCVASLPSSPETSNYPLPVSSMPGM